mmetsp:Transcript_13329/g.18206  ORF Transcript_13329/g.18206 Transcript_13329/m.18206 type:complete len:248 (+) Transcript_13329:325-1068(+)|eukprot:CAMPEP_0196593028 /NCGR_PEP_ID=MMETSP1081-20130531/74430_1 /TAXON_ID=36882 /ORGANISM="Pyramimonas amylifera, Strain CCMP720" /LENGTH=247 /DNA_ID=CAMNT_0041916879 /DNA_START=324 /DNA_END=1067 /DNA_ORIENTATION=-
MVHAQNDFDIVNKIAPSLCILSLIILAWNVETAAGNLKHSVNVRASFLALELIDVRCPSRFLAGFRSEFPGISLEINSLRYSGTRNILQTPRFVPSYHKTNLKEFTYTARALAIEKTHTYCTGAKDDRGPAVLLPLHLDTDGNYYITTGLALEVGPDPEAEGTATPAELVLHPVVDNSVPNKKYESDFSFFTDELKLNDDASPPQNPEASGVGPSLFVVLLLLILVSRGVGLLGYKYASEKKLSADG